MPFTPSTIPLEYNTGYIKSSVFSYAVFSEWFDKIKEVLDSFTNRSNMKSDRLEAVFDQVGHFLQITLCPTGFGMGTQPVVRVYYETPRISDSVIYSVPTRSGDETLEEVTKRWVLALHASIGNKIKQMHLRVRWPEFAFEGSSLSAPLPPPLFPPV